MLRTLIPAISAASIQLSFLAIAFKITSCSFIIRSISRAGITWLGFTSPASPAQLDRTTHVLIRPDNSHANDTVGGSELDIYRNEVIYNHATQESVECVTLRVTSRKS